MYRYLIAGTPHTYNVSPLPTVLAEAVRHTMLYAQANGRAASVDVLNDAGTTCYTVNVGTPDAGGFVTVTVVNGMGR